MVGRLAPTPIATLALTARAMLLLVRWRAKCLAIEDTHVLIVGRRTMLGRRSGGYSSGRGCHRARPTHLAPLALALRAMRFTEFQRTPRLAPAERTDKGSISVMDRSYRYITSIRSAGLLIFTFTVWEF